MFSKTKTLLFFLIGQCLQLSAIINFEHYNSRLALVGTTSAMNFNTAANTLNGTLQLRDTSTTILTGQDIPFTFGCLITNASDLGYRSVTQFYGNTGMALSPSGTGGIDYLKISAPLNVLSAARACVPMRTFDITTVTRNPYLLGSPVFTADNTLTNGSSNTLYFGLNNRLNKQILLTTNSNASFSLVKNLSLADYILFPNTTAGAVSGAYNVSLNNYSLETGFLDSTRFNETGMNWFSASGKITSLVHNSNGGYTLRSNFRTQIPMNGVEYIIGNGNVFDASDPLTTYIFDLASRNLTLENVYIVGKQLFVNTSSSPRSVILLDNVTIELQQYDARQTGGSALSYTVQMGNGSSGSINFIVRGKNCKIITGGNAMVFNNTSTNNAPCNLTIEDGNTLIYDTLSAPDTQNVRVTGSGVLSLGKGSRLLNVTSLSTPSNFAVAVDASSNSQYLLNQNRKLSASQSLTFNNSTPATPCNVNLDCAGCILTFPKTGKYLAIGRNVNLTVKNSALEDFSFDAINFADATSTLTFGNNVSVRLAKDTTLTSSGRPFLFSGSGTIDGKDYTFTLSGVNCISNTGTSSTVTLQNCQLNLLHPRCMSATQTSGTFAFNNCNLMISNDGFGIDNGNVEIYSTVKLNGYNASFYDFGNTALADNTNYLAGSSEFLAAIQRLAFQTNFALGYSTLTGNGKIGLQAYSTNNTSFRACYINNAQNLAYKNSATGSETVITGPFSAVGVGVDNKMWVIKTDRTIYRVDEPNTLVAAPNVGDLIAVGSANYVFVARNDTGLVYQNAAPTATSPGTWNALTDVTAVRSLAAGSDGSLWFIDPRGRYWSRIDGKRKLLHDGINYDFVKVCAAGTKTDNYIALLGSMANGGRILIARDNGPLLDVGLTMATDIAVDLFGGLACKFSNIVIPKHPTNGQPILYRPSSNSILQVTSSSANMPITVDQTFTFSSAGTFTIKNSGLLLVNSPVNLNYQANPINDGSNTAATKRHLLFESAAAQLVLNGGSLTSSDTGLAIDSGTINFQDSTNLYCSSKPAGLLEIGSAVNVNVADAIEINVYGPIRYGT